MELEAYAKALEAKHFLTQICKTRQEALDAALSLIGNRSVGIGGSVTVSQLGIAEALAERGNTVYCHKYGTTPAEKDAIRREAMRADVYVCSANAITEDGCIVQIDGTGNRIAALLFGPETAIVIAGKNKLVTDYDAAISRIKREACPPNAQRMGLKTPCALTGVCNNCTSPSRMCNATAIFERPTRAVKAFHVILVDEVLGL